VFGADAVIRVDRNQRLVVAPIPHMAWVILVGMYQLVRLRLRLRLYCFLLGFIPSFKKAYASLNEILYAVFMIIKKMKKPQRIDPTKISS
jgi:uncharacterized membrane protein